MKGILDHHTDVSFSFLCFTFSFISEKGLAYVLILGFSVVMDTDLIDGAF